MSRASFALLIMIGVLYSTTIAQRCPPNQEYTTCGSACQPTCEVLVPQACTMQCKIGCQCKAGYVLNPSNDCVPPSEC